MGFRRQRVVRLAERYLTDSGFYESGRREHNRLATLCLLTDD
jgi:hypothetical protein